MSKIRIDFDKNLFAGVFEGQSCLLLCKARLGCGKQIVHRMQEISYERGPYIVSQFHDYVTGYSDAVTGYRPYPNGEAGSDFRYREMGFKS